MDLLIGYLKAFPLEMEGIGWERVRTQLGGHSKWMCAYDGVGANLCYFGAYALVE